MIDACSKQITAATCQQYQALLAVGEAIVAHRDLKALLHDLAGRRRAVVRFNHIVLVRHEPETQLMHRHVFDTEGPVPAEPIGAMPVAEDPSGVVLQTQEPLVVSALGDLSRWP